jgi:tetratricopeptide (TPR) repeat protein
VGTFLFRHVVPTRGWLLALLLPLVSGVQAASVEKGPLPQAEQEHVTAAATSAEAPAAPATAATNAQRASWESLVQPTPQTEPEKPAAKTAEDYHTQFELARHSRLAGLYPQATAAFTALLQEPVPEHLQRAAMIELAQIAYDENDLPRAQQVLAHWLVRWPKDSAAPEVLLRQGLILRQMGLPGKAITKLYAVMTSALSLKPDRIDYYQKLVLRAQNEIAETHFQLGNWSEACESFGRLLKLEVPPANRSFIHYRLIHCLVGLNRRTEAIAQARDFLDRYAEAPERPEVQFLRARCLKQTGQDVEAREQVLALLREQHAGGERSAATLAYWQRRAGNEIANQFYQQGDLMAALDLYLTLAGLATSDEWQMPVWYQIGLIYERLNQPVKAGEYFGRVTQRESQLSTNAAPSLKALVEMARWRKDFREWQVKADTAKVRLEAALPRLNQTNSAPASPSTPRNGG